MRGLRILGLLLAVAVAGCSSPHPADQRQTLEPTRPPSVTTEPPRILTGPVLVDDYEAHATCGLRVNAQVVSCDPERLNNSTLLGGHTLAYTLHLDDDGLDAVTSYLVTIRITWGDNHGLGEVFMWCVRANENGDPRDFACFHPEASHLAAHELVILVFLNRPAPLWDRPGAFLAWIDPGDHVVLRDWDVRVTVTAEAK